MDSTYSNSSAWLECSICYEVMKEPRTLNCGHTFCCGCLQKLIDRVGNLKCPLDNRMFSVVRGNAGELMRNYKLEEAIEAVEAASARDLYYKCNRHKDRDAKMICNKCDVAYCSDCELEHARHGSKRSAQYTVESEPHQQQLQNQKQANPAASRPRRIRTRQKSVKAAVEEISVKAYKVDDLEWQYYSEDARSFQLKLAPHCWNNLKHKLRSQYRMSADPEIYCFDSDGIYKKIIRDAGLKSAVRNAPAPFAVYAHFSSQPLSSSSSRASRTEARGTKQTTVDRIGEHSGASIHHAYAKDASRSVVAYRSHSTVTAAAASNSRVHSDEICNGCEVRVHGILYNCQVCSDFKLCPSCKSVRPHHHLMLPTATSKYRQNSSRNTNREQYPFTTCSGCHRDVYSTYFVCTVCRSFNYCESCMWTRLHVHSMQIVTPERAEFADTNDFDYETVANYNDYEDYGEYSYRPPVRYSQPSGGRRKFFRTMIYVSSAIFLAYTLSRSRQRTTSYTASTILSSTLKQLCEYMQDFSRSFNLMLHQWKT